MMLPLKSVSFAAMLGEPEQDARHARCAACNMVDCRCRRAFDGEPQEESEP
jgi:hypothetical protein